MRAYLITMSLAIPLAWSVSACVGSGEMTQGNPDGNANLEAKCGDGVVGGNEQCDETDLGGATCESLGLSGGTLKCNLLTCQHDVSECVSTLKNDDGVCDRNLTCQPGGNPLLGNPQTMVECFKSVMFTGPARVVDVGYTIGPSPGAPQALNLEIYNWSGSGPPGALVSSTPLDAPDRTVGAHKVTLATPVGVSASTFCVGLASNLANDGYSIAFSDSATVAGASWARAPNCNLPNFVDAPSAANIVMVNWCITSTVGKGQ